MSTVPGTTTFYPPRAGRLKGWRLLWYQFRSALFLEQLPRPATIPSWRAFLLWVFVPGTVFLYREQFIRGRVILVVWAGAMLVYWWNFALPSSTLALLLICCLQALSISAAVAMGVSQDNDPRWRWTARFASFGISVAMCLAFQLGVVAQIVVPLTLLYGTEPVLINPLSRGDEIRRGDAVYYEIPKQDAIGFEPVLATAGETIRFAPTHIEVAGVRYERPAKLLPVEGALTVPDGECFIWPTRSLTTDGGYWEPNSRTEFLMSRSLVPKRSIRGKAYARWFTRLQTVPGLNLAPAP